MNRNHKNKFSKEARCKLIQLDMSITKLADELKRPRETVSKSIHSNRFPLVRKLVAKKLGITLTKEVAA